MDDFLRDMLKPVALFGGLVLIIFVYGIACMLLRGMSRMIDRLLP